MCIFKCGNGASCLLVSGFLAISFYCNIFYNIFSVCHTRQKRSQKSHFQFQARSDSRVRIYQGIVQKPKQIIRLIQQSRKAYHLQAVCYQVSFQANESINFYVSDVIRQTDNTEMKNTTDSSSIPTAPSIGQFQHCSEDIKYNNVQSYSRLYAPF